MSKHIILFLATNPLDSTELALSREARAIQEELERSGQRDRFEFVTRWAAQPLDLIRELRKLKPTVVHFSGHGGQLHSGPRRDVVTELGADASANDSDYHAGLLFQGPDGQPRFVTMAALRETFGATGTSVRLVVLNVCCSGMRAEALLVHIDCVIVVGCSLHEKMARAFAIGFYGGLGERQSVAAAYLQGCAAISLEAPSAFETPQLRVRDGVDADRLILAEINEEILELRGRLHERSAEKRRRWWMRAVPGAVATAAVAMAVLLLNRPPAAPLALNPLGVQRFTNYRLAAPELDARRRELLVRSTAIPSPAGSDGSAAHEHHVALRPDQRGVVGHRDPLGAPDDRNLLAPGRP